MKKVLSSFSVLALGVVTAASAGTVYVPVVQPTSVEGHRLPTRLWISNSGIEETSYRSAFLPTGVDGALAKGIFESSPRTIAAERTQMVDDAAESGRAGLVAIEAESALDVDAWIETRSGNRTHMGSIPVIGDFNRFDAGSEAFLNDLSRARAEKLALVNLGAESSFCKVDFVRADGTLAGGNFQGEVPAVSMKLFDDALGLRGVREDVSVRATCDQPFYVLGVERDRATSQVTFVSPADALAPAAVRPAAEKAVGPGNPMILFDRVGQFHVATVGHEKLKLAVPYTASAKLDKLTWDMDVTAGGWSDKLPACAHNIAFFNRGKYRSNTFTNLNAFGPNKFWMKNNQNIDQPRGLNTNNRINFTFVKGTTYHIRYEFDAVAKLIHIKTFLGLTQVATLDMKATAENHVLSVPVPGLNLEFGNLRGQVGCEVPSYNWKWANLHVEMFKHP